MRNDWFSRRELRRLACAVLGKTETERRQSCDETKVLRQREWELANDPSYLLAEYSSDWYALTLVECFANYTAANVRRFAEWWGDRDGEVLDLGAGIGASTRLFEELTRSECVCHVYGPGGQLDVARYLVGPSTILLAPDETTVFEHVRPSAVMAFELFEHVREPVALGEAIYESGADVLCCANAFGAVDFGHWRSYLVDGIEVPRDQIGRVFARRMREMGWTHEKTGFWNDRPSIWVRGETPEQLF